MPGGGSDLVGRPLLVVGAALVDRLADPRHLLAARRARPAQLAGRWELPGGKVEPGEDPATALHRELREELGVAVRLGAQVRCPTSDGDWPLAPSAVLRVWLAEIVSGSPAPLAEHDRLTWLGPVDWLAVDWLDADLPVVRTILPGGASP